jgi:hypothetical protein
MKTKSELIPGFSTYDFTPANDHNAVVPPAVAPTIAPDPIPQRLTCANAPEPSPFQLLPALIPVKRVTLMMMDLQTFLQLHMHLLIRLILMLLNTTPTT